MEGIHLIYLLVLFCFWKVTYCDEPQSLPLGPPQVAGTVNPEQRTRVGRTIKLECPAIGSPPPLIIWKKQDERIRTDWERYKINKDRPSLKIKNVQMEDAGEFVCQATNGFGSVNIKYTLTVIESKPKTEESLNPDDTTGTSPKFIKQLKMRKKTRVKPKGGTVHMNCKATGHPRPDIYWKKDGKNLTDDVLGTTKRGPSTLSLTKLKAEDSGVYTCIVSNRNGQINATYKLEVVDQPPIEVPRLIDELPVNTTVKYGETTSFQCKVQSEIVPHIQWLKRVEQHNKLKNSNTTIDMDGQEFIVLPPGQIAPQRDGTYLNKLTITKATQEDSGMYVCLGANTMGYSFKSAFLEVLPPGVGSDGSTGTTTNPQQVNDDDESFRSTIQYVIFIAIPSIVVIIFIIMLIMYCTGCRKSSSRPPPQVRQQQPLNQLGRQEPNEHTPQNLNKPYYPTPPQSHESYPVGFDKIVNHYQDFHPPTTYSDTLNSNGSLSSSRIYHYPHMNVHQC